MLYWQEGGYDNAPNRLLRATTRRVETGSSEARYDWGGKAVRGRWRRERQRRGQQQRAGARQRDEKGPRDVDVSWAIGKFFFSFSFLFFLTNKKTAIVDSNHEQSTSTTTSTAPPTAAVSNCSRGGNGEQRDGVTRGQRRTTQHLPPAARGVGCGC
jgi:hypothetical protein